MFRDEPALDPRDAPASSAVLPPAEPAPGLASPPARHLPPSDRPSWADTQLRLFMAHMLTWGRGQALDFERGQLDARLQEQIREAEALRHHLATLTQSKVWKLCCLLRSLRRRLIPEGSTRNLLLHRAWQGLRWLRRGPGRTSPAPEAAPAEHPSPLPCPVTHLSAEQSARVLAGCPRRPLISLAAPVYKLDPRWLDCCVASVRAQHYPHWELLLVDDGSGDPALTRRMQAWAKRDERIRVFALETNRGISAATNVGIGASRGRFVGLLDSDDELTPDALTWVVALHNRRPDAVWFYSDEDKLDERGTPYDAFHKPDFSPEYLLSIMYTCHFSVYDRDLLARAGGLRPAFDGAQDHDLALRLSEQVFRWQIVHIPRVLYHARSAPTPDPEAGRRAVREALARRGLQGEVSSDARLPTLYRLDLRPGSCPRVSILIPTRNALREVKTCVESLHARTRYPNYEVVVLDNQSDDPALFRYLGRQERRRRLRVHPYPEPFNHSAMNNEATRACESEYVVFLNNDTEQLTEGWLEQLVATAQLDPSVAGVGAMLLYPDRTIQHAGVVLGLYGIVGHSHKYLPEGEPGYFARPHSLGEYSGCTAAMLLVKRRSFLEVGGFSETRYPTTFNDVDLWLKLRRAGYRCLYNPGVRAIHHESKTRPIQPAIEQEYQRRLVEDWGPELLSDPFYNPNLSLLNEQFQGTMPYPVQLDFPNELGRYQFLTPG